MDITMLLVVGGIILAVASAFTRVPLWIGVLLIGLGIALGLR
jgi:hypothetical protein